MRASTEVEVVVDGRGRSVARVLRCEAPLLVRVADEPGDRLTLLMVGGAAGPLGGDELRLRLTIGPGADVTVRSVGATMVQPGPHGGRSTTHVHASVAAGASLDWWPEPTVSVVGSDHRATTTIELAGDARLRWADEVSLGRSDEPPGRLAMRQRLEIDGVVMIDHETEFGSAALAGPGGHGDGRCVLSGLLVGDDAPARPSASADASNVDATRSATLRGVFPIAPRVALVTCIGSSRGDPSFGLTV